MAILSSTNVAVFCVISTLYVVYRFFGSKSKVLPLPPGPKPVPFIGNINDLPKPGVPEWDHWLKHKDLYGPISSITVLGQTFVIVNDAEITLEMLRDRAAIYSDRPATVFGGEMVGWKNVTVFLQYDETLKAHRKNIAKVAGSSVSVAAFDRVQEEEAAHFLLDVLDSPENLFQHIRQEAAAVILRIVYGYTPERTENDPLVVLIREAMEAFSESSAPGQYLVDILPFLRYLPDWVPGTEFKRTARRIKKLLYRSVEEPYAFVRHQMRDNKAKTSFVSQSIDSVNIDEQMERIYKWSAGAMYGGGADTTVSSLMTFFLAMALFPDVQRKAQEEIDRVVGNKRLPVTADKEQLPYIDAIVKETHRWHPVAPMAIPHCCTKDDVVRGYRIPKGAMVLPNTWWSTHDPAIYPDPMTFRPERYLSTSTHTAEPDPRTWTFGYGRRVCPGRHVADNALFMTIAQALAVFNVQKPVENGRVVEPDVQFTPGVVSHPMPYRVSVKPRSEQCKELIQKIEQVYPWRESDAKVMESLF
ncbi:cytochrome P450 [Decorospora gaudefroyi]|uniref:Cytochrome P450 n=1 Tax=Decorospora gaudefroyi TaxID=184978 RepID=A0A6A5KP91_9PLEO|nr:cytochrome P450 [Decorospora gaudefroyi]